MKREIKFRVWEWADEARVCGNIYMWRQLRKLVTLVTSSSQLGITN